MSSNLKSTAGIILLQLAEMCRQLSDEEFGKSLDMLQGNSVGKHLRHVIEFFELLVTGSPSGAINYDLRQHDSDLENRRNLASDRLQQLIQSIASLDTAAALTLSVSYGRSQDDAVAIPSGVARELAYNIEHAIHHMAIMKIAIVSRFSWIVLPENFGVAYSTQRYRNSSQTSSQA